MSEEKYRYHPDSTIHYPIELQGDEVRTWTLNLNGRYLFVTREVWEAYHANTSVMDKTIDALMVLMSTYWTKSDIVESLKANGFDSAAEYIKETK